MNKLTTVCYDGTIIETSYDPNYFGPAPDRVVCNTQRVGEEPKLTDWEWVPVDPEGLSSAETGDAHWDYAQSIECEEQIAELHRGNVNSYNKVNGGRRL